MNTLEALADAAVFIASRRQAAHLDGNEEEERIWLYLRALTHFVRATGQVYRFEDSLEMATPAGAHRGGFARLAGELLLKVLDETAEPQQKQQVLLPTALIHFIVDTGQSDAAEDFFVHQLEYAPVAIAHFASIEEADAWLRSVAEPPSPAYILIGDEYHQFWYRREDSTRGMYRDYPIETEMEALTARGIPPRPPSFATRAEAEAWLTDHPANPYTFVRIAGEDYFAVNHRRLKRHSLHHVASALKAWEERKRAVAQEDSLEAAQSGKARV
ncbi:hypothetical protein [Hyalangium gracile]|uniref:hypothetical protein n=1 Tax=Hyalangium gracile TaxID=394092 RepID=UPI001CCAE695|nr:hypothetical protein [Hyalangium gracile]